MFCIESIEEREEAHERADSSHGGAAGVTVAEESLVVAEGDRS